MQFFKQSYTFFVINLKATFRSFSAVFFGLLFTLIFVASFGMVNSEVSKVSIGVIESDSPAYFFWKEALANSDSITLKTGSAEDLKIKFQDNTLDALIETVAESPKAINLYVSTKRQTTAAIAEQLINTYIDKTTIAAHNLEPAFIITRKNIDTSSPRYSDYVLPGLIGFSLLNNAIHGLASSFLTLKKTQALKRLFAAPASPAAFIIGKSAAALAFSLLQVTILLIASAFLFNYTPAGGWTTIAQMYLVIILGITLFQGIGFIIAGISNTVEQAAAISQLVTLPQFMLGGTFFAVTTLPSWLQPIIKALPLYSFNEAMRALSLQGLQLTDGKVWPFLWPLMVWIILVYAVATKVFRVK